MDITKNKKFSLIASVGFILCTVLYVIEWFPFDTYYAYLIISIVISAFLGISILINKTPILTLIGLFSYIIFKIYDLIMWVTNSINSDPCFVIYDLYNALICLLLIVIITFTFIHYLLTKTNINLSSDNIINATKKIVFIGSILCVISQLSYTVFYILKVYLFHGAFIFSRISLLVDLLTVISVCFLDLSVVYSGSIPKKDKKTKSLNTKQINKSNSDLYTSLGKHIVLYLFTFGIWQLIWIHKTTNNLNGKVENVYRSGTKELLLCMFIPFYLIFWIYKTAQIVDSYAKQKNLRSDISTICLILSFFVPIVPPIIIQDKINSIVSNEGTLIQDSDNTKIVEKTFSTVSSADELKKFSELLNDGIITQEEFDAKKKELLSL